MTAREVNFDGLVGLTHHYAGLSFGNEASTRNRHQQSNPKLAAQQGLLKMKALADRGFAQAVIPPMNVLIPRRYASLVLAAVMPRYWQRSPDRHRSCFLLSAPLLRCGSQTPRRFRHRRTALTDASI